MTRDEGAANHGEKQGWKRVTAGKGLRNSGQGSRFFPKALFIFFVAGGTSFSSNFADLVPSDNAHEGKQIMRPGHWEASDWPGLQLASPFPSLRGSRWPRLPQCHRELTALVPVGVVLLVGIPGASTEASPHPHISIHTHLVGKADSWLHPHPKGSPGVDLSSGPAGSLLCRHGRTSPAFCFTRSSGVVK